MTRFQCIISTMLLCLHSVSNTTGLPEVYHAANEDEIVMIGRNLLYELLIQKHADLFQKKKNKHLFMEWMLDENWRWQRESFSKMRENIDLSEYHQVIQQEFAFIKSQIPEVISDEYDQEPEGRQWWTEFSYRVHTQRDAYE